MKPAGAARLWTDDLFYRHPGATPKVCQGVPRSLVMLATGHQTEAQFNVYPGLNEQELLAAHEQTARRRKNT